MNIQLPQSTTAATGATLPEHVRGRPRCSGAWNTTLAADTEQLIKVWCCVQQILLHFSSALIVQHRLVVQQCDAELN